MIVCSIIFILVDADDFEHGFDCKSCVDNGIAVDSLLDIKDNEVVFALKCRGVDHESLYAVGSVRRPSNLFSLFIFPLNGTAFYDGL